MKCMMNRPGPHARDYSRLIRLAEAVGLSASTQTASTGTVYVSVSGDEDDRVYRFGAHATCYATEDYSVASGADGERAKRAGLLPPGYDGTTDEAIEDMIGHFGIDRAGPSARRALAAIKRTRAARRARLAAKEDAQRQWNAREAERVARVQREQEAQRAALRSQQEARRAAIRSRLSADDLAALRGLNWSASGPARHELNVSVSRIVRGDYRLSDVQAAIV